MKTVIKAEEINYAVYRYLAENGYMHSAFTFRQEAKIPQNVVAGHLPVPGDLASRGRSRAYFPPHCLISLIQKAMLYLWIEFHTDRSSGAVLPCQQQFSLFRPHSCKRTIGTGPSPTARTEIAKPKPKSRPTPTRKTRKDETPDTHARTKQEDPDDSADERLPVDDIADQDDTRTKDDAVKRPRSNSVTGRAVREAATGAVVGFWKDEDRVLGGVKTADGWDQRTEIAGDKGAEPEILEVNDDGGLVVIRWKDPGDAGDVRLYNTENLDRTSRIDLGEEALKLLNVTGIKWNGLKSFTVTIAGRREPYSIEFTPTDDENAWTGARSDHA